MAAIASGRLHGKRTLVTGGAKGIGYAIVERFVEEGASVLLTDIDESAGLDAAKALGADFMKQDVGDEASWPKLMNETRAKFDGLDVLVNNAGLGDLAKGNSPEDTTLDEWRRIFRVNAEGVFLGCRAAIPVMAESGGGSIINLSSIAALAPTPFITAYGASKAAVLQLSKSIALHCAQNGHNIRCNTIHPGQITTPMHDGLIRDVATAAGAPEEAVRADFLSRIPMGEFGQTLDIANAALFLASDEARHITGEQMVVDGGMQLTN
jgi:3(or 17)beta-hydroxysteroid dehydrogenase